MSIKSPPRPGSRITKIEPTNPAIASMASASTGAALADPIYVGRACDEARCVTVALATPPPKIGTFLLGDGHGERG